MKKHIQRVTKKIPQFDEAQMMFTLAAVVGVVAVGLVIWFAVQYFAGPRGDHQQIIEEFTEEEPQDERCDYARVLDGVCVESEDDVNPKVVVVTIENHPDARPQSGLAEASIVYEAPVEANFTRFLAVYPADADIGKAGPVRSVRPYFLDWVSEYGDAVYMHVGGSPEALEKVTTIGTNSVNEFFRGWLFWRSSDRYAPHNTYTSSKLWTKAIEDYSEAYEKTEYMGWRFTDMEPCEEECIVEIDAIFNGATYTGSWVYDDEADEYTRYQSGYIHRDQKGTPIVANSIIIQRVETEVLDAVGRLAMDTIGEGEAIVFRNGHMIEGRWKKDSRTERTQFLDENGEAIGLQAGKIWVEVVNERGSVLVNGQ